MKNLREQVHHRWIRAHSRWLQRRIPAAKQQILTQRNLFIFPTRTGAAFLGLLTLLGLAALNYQNNLIYALVFLLTSLFVVSILHTFANMAGLEVSGAPAEPVFCGDYLSFPVRLRSTKQRSHEALILQLAGAERHTLSVGQGETKTAILSVKALRRGDVQPGRLRVESIYPLGFLRCWTLVDLDQTALVYPARLTAMPVSSTGADAARSRPEVSAADGDFRGIREYRSGDSLRHIHWPSVAKTGRMHTRLVDPPDVMPRWLEWQHMSRTDTEGRLSQLCDLALRFHQQQFRYGLRLPGVTIAPGRGAEHRHRVLAALARFGTTTPPRGAE